jgi:hypothetical protein
MPDRSTAVFKGAFVGPDEDQQNRGRRPVIFDILAPDRSTSLLDSIDQDLRLVLHVNPKSMQFRYAKQTERVQTRAGWVEFHWGDAAEDITFEAATGGFMRLFTGLSNVTGFGSGDQGRRETIAYDKYLDLLALFHNNGAIYDAFGNIAVQGYLKVTFDGGTYIGWFDTFTVTEEASRPFLFSLSAKFIIDKESMQFRSILAPTFAAQSSVVSSNLAAGQTAPSTAVLDPVVDTPFEDL